jgi:hypothetical protein
MIALITAGSAAAYITSFLLVARRVYQTVRPSTVAQCGYESGAPHPSHGANKIPGTHFFSCYKRFGPINRSSGILNTQRAVAVSLLAGLTGPAALAVYLAVRVITARPPEDPDERKDRLIRLATRNGELELENRKLAGQITELQSHENHRRKEGDSDGNANDA